MESPLENIGTQSVPIPISTTPGPNSSFVDNIDLPDDTFRMSLDFSVIGENVTIADRVISVDSSATSSGGTPVLQIVTPFPTPDVQTPPVETSPPIIETPKLTDDVVIKPQSLLKLSFTKKNENDIFVKPSPVMEIMSPAKMLQFEVDVGTSATPTMKRAAIDFDFFSKNNFEKYFDDVPKNASDTKKESEKAYEETPVIVKASTVRHEIAYGKYCRQV